MTAPRRDALDETDSRLEEVPTPERSQLPPWPLRGRAVGILLAAYAILSATGLVIGLALTQAQPRSPLDGIDPGVTNGIVEERTSGLTRWLEGASMLSDTFVVIGALIVLTAVFLWSWRRWGEALLLDAALALEASVFLTVSLTVGRERPPVDQLQAAPPTASFPSGHAGAATAFYLGLAYIVSRNIRSTPLRIAVFSAAVVLIALVGFSRLYLGMHYLTDVAVGMVFGAICLVVALWAVRAGIRRHGDRRREIL